MVQVGRSERHQDGAGAQLPTTQIHIDMGVLDLDLSVTGRHLRSAVLELDLAGEVNMLGDHCVEHRHQSMVAEIEAIRIDEEFQIEVTADLHISHRLDHEISIEIPIEIPREIPREIPFLGPAARPPRGQSGDGQQPAEPFRWRRAILLSHLDSFLDWPVARSLHHSSGASRIDRCSTRDHDRYCLATQTKK